MIERNPSDYPVVAPSAMPMSRGEAILYMETLDELEDAAELAKTAGKEDEAEACFKALIVDTGAQYAEVFCEYASFLIHVRKDLDAAEAIYKQGMLAVPDNGRTFSDYGNFLAEHRHAPEAATPFYEKNIWLLLQDFQTIQNHYDTLMGQDDLAALESFFTYALNVVPSPQLYRLRAFFFTESNGDDDAAEKFYNLAIEADPTDSISLSSYAIFLAERRGDYAKADAFHQAAIRSEPWHPEPAMLYATFLEEKVRDDERAEAFFRVAIEKAPQNASMGRHFGRFLLGRNRLVEARAVLREAWKHHPNEEADDLAELVLYLWVESCMSGKEDKSLLRVLKGCFTTDLRRDCRDLQTILSVGQEQLTPSDCTRLKILADALRYSDHVGDLEKIPGWSEIEPLEPGLIDLAAIDGQRNDSRPSGRESVIGRTINTVGKWFKKP